MVFRMLLGNLVREAAQAKLGELVSGQSSAEVPEQVDVAVVFALSIEAGGMFDRLSDVVSVRGDGYVEHFGTLDDKVIALVETGPGQRAAGRATRSFVKLRRPAWVISAGFAGGLDERLRRGDVLMTDEIVNAQGERLEVGLSVSKEALAAAAGVHVGRLLSTEKLVCTPEEKYKLGQQHRALACDMETMAVAHECIAAKVRLLSIRLISDAVADRLPPEVEGLLDQKSLAGKLGAATGALWNRPSSAKDMWKLKEQAIKASDRLATFLVGVINQLPT